MTAEQIAQIVQTVIAMVQAEPGAPDVKARLVEMRAELDAIIALLDTPAAEQEKPVKPPNPPIVEPLPIPPSLEPAEEKKPGKWGNVWNVTKRVLKVAGPVALAGATGGGSLAAYAPTIISALSDPTVAATAAGGVAGAVSAGVRIYGAVTKKE